MKLITTEANQRKDQEREYPQGIQNYNIITWVIINLFYRTPTRFSSRG